MHPGSSYRKQLLAINAVGWALSALLKPTHTLKTTLLTSTHGRWCKQTYPCNSIRPNHLQAPAHECDVLSWQHPQGHATLMTHHTHLQVSTLGDNWTLSTALPGRTPL